MNTILLTVILAANPQSLPYEAVAISLPYTGEITLPQKPAINPATKKPLDPIDQEFLEREHWRLSPGTCGMLGCTIHGGGWVKEKIRVPVAKPSRDRKATRSPVAQQRSGSTQSLPSRVSPSVSAPNNYQLRVQPRPIRGPVCRLLRGG